LLFQAVYRLTWLRFGIKREMEFRVDPFRQEIRYQTESAVTLDVNSQNNVGVLVVHLLSGRPVGPVR